MRNFYMFRYTYLSKQFLCFPFRSHKMLPNLSHCVSCACVLCFSRWNFSSIIQRQNTVFFHTEPRGWEVSIQPYQLRSIPQTVYSIDSICAQMFKWIFNMRIASGVTFNIPIISSCVCLYSNIVPHQYSIDGCQLLEMNCDNWQVQYLFDHKNTNVTLMHESIKSCWICFFFLY